MEIRIHYPTDGQAVTITDGAQTETVPAWRDFSEIATIHSGRLNVLPSPLASPPPGGRQFQRADGAWVLDMTDVVGADDLILPEGVYRGFPLAQKRGFSSGVHYWLAKDANGVFVPKPGRLHRKIYVTASPAAYTKAAIAQHAGVAETSVTGSWLAARPVYGSTEAMAVSYDVYLLLMAQLNGRNKVGRSDWIRFERGYTYGTIKPTGDQGYNLKGESEIHPLVFEAWGTGTDPVVSIGYDRGGPRHIMTRNLSTTYFNIQYAANVIISGGTHTDDGYMQGGNTWGFTIHNAIIVDHRRVVPDPGQLTWDGSGDRTSGQYFSSVVGAAIEGCLVDTNGWGPGYDYRMSTAYPMSPSDRNHGIYWQFTNKHALIRDNWVTRNSSAGQQVRTGGLFERNIYIDNNYAVGGGSGTDLGYINQFMQEHDLVIFGAGYKRVLSYQGVINGAFLTTGPRHARFGSVVAHIANPDDPAEIADRTTGRSPYLTPDEGYSINEVKVWRWKNPQGAVFNENVGGLSEAVLNTTTPHRWAGSKLGKTTATLDELVAWIKQRNMPIGQAAREFNDWVRSRFGYSVPSRTAAATVNFVPNEHGEGFRADNRRNWSTLDLPGRNAGDTINLKGRFVRFGTTDHVVAAMVSEGGKVDVTGGLLAPGTLSDAAEVSVRHSGYFRAGSAPHALKIVADSGFTHLTGTTAALDMIARGHAEIVFGPNTHIPAGKKLVLSGERVMAGWDGTGTATLTVAGTLEFRAGCRVNTGGAYAQKNMVTGNVVTGPGFAAILADYEEMWGNNTDRVHLCDIEGTPSVGGTFQYGFEDIHNTNEDRQEPMFKTIAAIGSRGFSMLRVFRSGFVGDGLTEPTVAASLVLAAGSTVVIQGRDYLTAGTYDLTGPGVTVTDNGAILPAGVSVAGGKLVLVV